MNYQLTTILLLFSAFYSFGQSEKTVINGRILEFKKPIADAHLYNLNALNATSTSKEGTFKIAVNLNDTIIVSHIKYQTLRIIITENYLKQDTIVIYMEEMTNKLDTIHIKNHDLTGSLITDFKKEKFTRIDQKHKLIEEYMRLAKMPSFKNYGIDLEKPPMNNVDPTAGAGINILGILDILGIDSSIGFKSNDLGIRRKLRNKKNFTKQIIAEMGIPYFTRNLKILEEKIHHFLTYCEHRDILKLYQKNEIMKVLTILQEESVEYLKIK